MEKDASLLTDLESLLEPKGDPMSLLKWTTKSVAHLQEALERMGHEVAQTTIRRILRRRGYSLRANKKNSEGTSHPDRDAQFEHIHATCQAFEQHGNPIISVDCKKKELLGQFKNNGAEWQAKGEATEVMSMTFFRWQMAKPSPMGSTTWFTIRGSSMWGLIMTPLSLRWKVSDAGGSREAKRSIRARKHC